MTAGRFIVLMTAMWLLYLLLLAVADAETCAPLLRDAAALAALQSRLLQRAQTLGWSLVDDPGLCVVAGGQAFLPSVESGRCVFRLPRPMRDARLRSRSRIPARMEPGSDDARRLGVGVAGLVVDGAAAKTVGDGWHGIERDAAGAFGWTNGDAALPPGQVVEIEIVHRRRYWVGPAPSALARGAAVQRAAC